MPARLLILGMAVLICTFALAGAVEAAQSPPLLDRFDAVADATGGGYRLARLEYTVVDIASGPGYRLQTVTDPNLRGNGCCCIFLPRLQR